MSEEQTVRWISHRHVPPPSSGPNDCTSVTSGGIKLPSAARDSILPKDTSARGMGLTGIVPQDSECEMRRESREHMQHRNQTCTRLKPRSPTLHQPLNIPPPLSSSTSFISLPSLPSPP
ncbi:unnamed protein product [Pleuronectes platessa]|uniref:Uncharacterized protein n=1 Tax=Pleuronectes platessa TaxID=8262 RepID=A0A9N7VMR4_PLEPL|nr:unnamed protein product [Pleuronectes platessa]